MFFSCVYERRNLFREITVFRPLFLQNAHKSATRFEGRVIIYLQLT